MIINVRLMLLGAALILLSGCASLTATPTYLNEAEVLAARGEPSRVWNNADGTRTLEYATQPYGDTCWMYTADGSGRMVGQFDALSRRNLARVERGMTVEDVQRLLGQHRAVQRFPMSGEEVYDWNIRNEWPDLVATRFNVHFIDGQVERTSQEFVYPREGWAFGIGIGHGMHPYWGVGMGWGWPYQRGWPHYW